MDYLKRYGVTEAVLEGAKKYKGFALARVIAEYKGAYRVVTKTQEIPAEITGKLRHETTEFAQYPTVGDFVMVKKEEKSEFALISHILERKSVFLRTAVGAKGQAQAISANIDILFICMSLNNNFKLSRLERYLSVAWDSGATPVILLTKADLCQDLDDKIAQVESVATFTDIIALSIYHGNIEEKLEEYLKEGVTAAFVGSSGVGKSSMINRLMGEELILTKEIDKAGKGRHTTTGRSVFLTPKGGILIDTPGMRELGVENVDLSKSFDDVETLAQFCRFKDCTHKNEPGCAVMEAIEKGELDQRRLENYRKIKIEAGYEGLNAKQIETKKLERMFQEVGGMKNRKKFVKNHHKYN